MALTIDSWVRIDNRSIARNGEQLPLVKSADNIAPEDVYRQLQYNYHKFFKMDVLSKWAWTGVEILLNCNNVLLYNGLDASKVGIVLATGHGCLEADKKYDETLSSIASPALFVYTLPNIMLGEISIRHGFKGEQLCLVSKEFNPGELYFWVSDLVEKRGMEACVTGWIDVTADKKDIRLYWVTKNGKGRLFTDKLITD